MMDAITKYEMLNGIVLPSQRPVARTVRAILTREEVELLKGAEKGKRGGCGQAGSILVF